MTHCKHCVQWEATNDAMLEQLEQAQRHRDDALVAVEAALQALKHGSPHYGIRILEGLVADD